jgi:hypothetical protein
MTREQAIQEQIDQCMDWFDFDLCCEVSKLLIAQGKGYPEDWLMEGEPSAGLLRSEARKLLRRAANTSGEHATDMASYLKAEKWEGIDEETGDPFVSLQLSFVVEDNITQDGTAYEAQPPKTKD